ncbi:MAG: hypothetical protein EBW99_03855 [Actinobacteria bacterium]|nr:hypothetical protein [Actinomycetota bacterium]
MIESLNSPHIARVKALIGSRGTKERKSSSHFVAEGLQCAREAIVATTGPRIETLYVTPTGRLKVEQIADLNSFNVIEVSDDVMKAMSETITPQGILAVCSIPVNSLESITLNGTRKFVYLSEIQDPGNAGTIEARGLATAQGVSSIEQVKISMPGNAESLNLSAAATIVMYHLANIPSS